MRDIDKNVVQLPDIKTLQAEAAEWIIRLDGEDATAQDRAAFQEWQSRSTRHGEAAARLGNLWVELDALDELADPIEARTIAHPEPQKFQFWREKRLRPRQMFIYAAACILLAIIAIPVYTSLRTSPPTLINYETAIGAQKTVTLPDGSTVYVNTNSRIEVAISNKRRDVRLVRGEAYFEVAHDNTRPFTVYAGNGLVRDIGTAFDVRLLARSVDVTVARGNVELATLAGGKQSAPQLEQHLGNLAAGQKAIFDRKVEHLVLVSDATINRQLAWRQGVLVYDGQPLAQVVADFSRYTDVTVEISDPKLRDLPVGGYFEIGRSDAFFEALEANFGVRAQWRDPNHVRLVMVSAGKHSRKSNAR